MHQDKIIFKKENRLARVIINNEPVRNAISKEMRDGIVANFKEWAGDAHIYAIAQEAASPAVFSSGADLKEVFEAFERNPDEALGLFKHEYEAVWVTECYNRPVISFIDGAIMGGGVGLAQHGTHIVAGENFAWSMPECKIGLFPDIGICYYLSRMPHAIGIYLGLTGRSINRDEAFYLELLEHCIDSRHFEDIKIALSDATPVDPMLDGLRQVPDFTSVASTSPNSVVAMSSVIESVFSKDTVEEMVAALKVIGAEHQIWANSVLEDLELASPLSLKVTLEALSRAGTMEFHEVLAQDYMLAEHFLKGGDFIAAIRAKLIDKTEPVFTPALLMEVPEAMVAAYFKETSADLLDLPARELGIFK